MASQDEKITYDKALAEALNARFQAVMDETTPYDIYNYYKVNSLMVSSEKLMCESVGL